VLTVCLCDIYDYGEFQQKPVFTAFQGTEVRTHDLRHGIASVGLASGDALPIIGKLLGHSDVKTTARYAHLADDPVKAAANRISGSIAAAMAGAPRAKMVALGKLKRPLEK
jgi:hypothetical protein